MAEKHYKVKWEIDVWARTPNQAAVRALNIQRDPNSHATIFTVEYHKETTFKSGKRKSQYVRKTVDLMDNS